MSSSNSDPDFVVADELSEDLSTSDFEDSPKLSLMDRIQRKSRTATGGKKKLAPGAKDDDSKPEMPNITNGRKKPLVKDPKVRMKTNSVRALSEAKASSDEDAPVSKGKKKTLVIESSESETEFDHIRRLETPGRKATEDRREPAVVISSGDDSGDGFVNIYSPKYYDKVPPPDPKQVSKPSIAEPKPKSKPKVVRGSKVSPTSFKTPVRSKVISALAARDAPDTPTLTFLSSLTQVTVYTLGKIGHCLHYLHRTLQSTDATQKLCDTPRERILPKPRWSLQGGCMNSTTGRFLGQPCHKTCQ